MAWWKVLRFAALLLFSAVVAMPLGGLRAQEKGLRVTVELNEFDDSGISGTAVLTTLESGGTQVSMELRGAELDGDHPTHIHNGTCDDFDPNPLYPLETVELVEVDREGISETTLDDVTIDSLWDGKFVILVHQSPEQLTTYLVCGEIGSGERASLTAAALAERGEASEAHTQGEESGAAGHSVSDDQGNSGQGVSVRVEGGIPRTGAGSMADNGYSRALLSAAFGTLAALALLSGAALRHRRR